MIGYSVEAHVSPVNGLGIGALHSGYKNKNSQPYKLNETIIQAGYYSPFRNENVQFQIYGGVVFGKFSANNYFDSSNNFIARVDANYFDYFIQPGIIYSQGNFSLSSGLKMGSRKFNNIVLYQNEFDYLTGDSWYGYIQPFTDLSLGHRNYKFNMQFLLSPPLGGETSTIEDDVRAILFSPIFPQYVNISLGVKIDITKDMFRFK